jgi:hypothetical protein
VRVESIICDECTTVKGATNHWYKARLAAESGYKMFAVASFDVADENVAPKTNWDNMGSVIHLCSQQCVTARLSKWMNPATETREST